jgi:hypothetical protein
VNPQELDDAEDTTHSECSICPSEKSLGASTKLSPDLCPAKQCQIHYESFEDQVLNRPDDIGKSHEPESIPQHTLEDAPVSRTPSLEESIPFSGPPPPYSTPEEDQGAANTEPKNSITAVKFLLEDAFVVSPRSLSVVVAADAPRIQNFRSRTQKHISSKPLILSADIASSLLD